MASKRNIFLTGIGFELIIIGYLIFFVFNKYQSSRNVLGAVSVSTVDKNNLIFSQNSELKYFYEPKPNIIEKDNPSWLNKEVSYTINSDSLNERYDYEQEKANDVFRIVTLGDSFTYGKYVNTSENWTEQLEELLNNNLNCKNIKKFEVINLGVEGYDIQYITHRYLTRGQKYNPDLIIWLESGSGFTRLDEFFSPIIDWCSKNISEDYLAASRKKGDYYPCWTEAQKELRSKYSDEEIALQQQVFLKSFLNMIGEKKMIYSTFSNLSNKRKSIARDWFKSQTNVFLDNNISNIRFKNGTLPDGHPNVVGHKIIAEDIFTYIKSKGVISCE